MSVFASRDGLPNRWVVNWSRISGGRLEPRFIRNFCIGVDQFLLAFSRSSIGVSCKNSLILFNFSDWASFSTGCFGLYFGSSSFSAKKASILRLLSSESSQKLA
jgi:hypothetical protein